MKICVCSDSHGRFDVLQTMTDCEKPRMIIYLGDGLNDWQQVTVPEGTELYTVCGNCDLTSTEPTVRRLEVFGLKAVMTHGHQHKVRLWMRGLKSLADAEKAEIVFYGHTHKADVAQIGNTVFMNPGAAADGKYGVVTAENGKTEYLLKSID